MLSVSKTSTIRPAETDALGNITNIIEIIKKLITTSVPYCIAAIKSPTCILDAATLSAPTHNIKRLNKFIISIIAGIIILIERFINLLFFITFSFTSSNLFSSYFCVPKALTTINPDRFSLATKLILSTNFCTIFIFGKTVKNKNTINKIIHPQAKAIVQIKDVDFCDIIINAPTPIIGA